MPLFTTRQLRAALLAGTALTFAACGSARTVLAQEATTNLSGSTDMSIPAGSTLTNTETGNTNYSGVLSDSGRFVNSGNAGTTLTLSGGNSYSGGTEISGGTLSLSGAGALGSGDVTVDQPATLAIASLNTNAPMVANGLSGSGHVSISAGQMLVDQVGNSTFSGNISGAGALSVAYDGVQGDNSPVLILTGTNTYSGGTYITAGQAVINNGASLGSGPVAITQAGTLDIIQSLTLQNAISTGSNVSTGGFVTTETSVSADLAGNIAGAGALGKNGAGTLTLSGQNTYSGGTSVDAGTLALGAGNAAGSGSLAIAQGAVFAMNGFDQAVTDLEGAGQITSTGGGLTVQSGTFTGTSDSTGSLTKSGGGTLLFNGANTYSGGTTISGGTLQVGDAAHAGASLTGDVTVESGGTLQGHGSLFGNLANSGTVAPGGSIGTLSVNGNYVQNAGGTLAVELSPAGASKLAVSGTASLAGTLAVLPASGTYAPGSEYTILTAGNGVTGTFTRMTTTPASVMFTEIYRPNEVDLIVMAPAMQQSVNEAGMLDTIEAILPAAPAGAFASGLVSLATAPSAGPDRTQIAGVLGELRSDIATIDLANLTSFQNFIVERMASRQGMGSTTQANNGLPGTFDVAMNDSDMMLLGPAGSNSVVTVDQPSFWVHGYGVLGEAGGDTGFQDFQYNTGGIVAGVDAKVTDKTLVGAAVAYEHTDFHLSDDVADSNTIDTYRVTVYGSQALDPVPLTIDAAFGYAFNDYHDNESLSVPGFALGQTSRHDGNELTAEAGLSHGFQVDQNLVSGALSVVPRVGVEYDNIQQDKYTTTATVNGLGLNTNGSTLNALRSTVGAKADLKMVTHDGTVITPEIRATYLHDFEDTNIPLTESFTGAPGTGFRVAGVHPGRDAALAGAGLNVGFSEHLSATIGYDAAVRTHELDHTVQVGAKYTW